MCTSLRTWIRCRSPVAPWGHLQEYALCEAGIAFNRPEFIEAARRSAEAVLLPTLDWCVTAEHVLPFDMSCTVLGLAAVRRATGNVRYGQAAQQARAWFARRNAAGKPVYDRSRGIVYDGVDEGRVNRNSGAESNIEGGLALVGSAPASVGPVREHELLVVAVCRPIGFSSDRRAGQRWSVALRKHHRPIRFDVA
jgi:hypothetical protein